jgi:hypothetical protein
MGEIPFRALSWDGRERHARCLLQQLGVELPVNIVLVRRIAIGLQSGN